MKVFKTFPIVASLRIGAAMLALSFQYACKPKPVDLDDHYPYKAAIGKKFSLQCDMYIMRLLNGSDLMLGQSKLLPAGSGIPEIVNSQYIGVKSHSFEIVGVAKKGDSFKIVRILRAGSSCFPAVDCLVIFEAARIAERTPISTIPLEELNDNPPNAETWSSPPIFKRDYALPEPSDGQWWKP